MQKIHFSRMRNRQFEFSPKLQYVLTAERSEAASAGLRFPVWSGILEIARTCAAHTGGANPREKMQGAAKPHRRKPPRSPEKNIGANHSEVCAKRTPNLFREKCIFGIRFKS